MCDFEIKESLKEHYLFEYPVMELIKLFKLLFEKEKEELLRQFTNRLNTLYGEPNFSNTLYNISDMIVYKYFNDDLSQAYKYFIKCSKFKEYPFVNKILELESKT